MAESSSTGPLEGEALRLLEPAIRPLSPNTKHVRAAELEGCVLKSKLLLGGEVVFRGCFARVYFLGRVKLDDAREKATRVAGGGRSRGDAAGAVQNMLGLSTQQRHAMDAAIDLSDATQALNLSNIRFQLM
jgi:hypothetical protein